VLQPPEAGVTDTRRLLGVRELGLAGRAVVTEDVAAVPTVVLEDIGHIILTQLELFCNLTCIHSRREKSLQKKYIGGY